MIIMIRGSSRGGIPRVGEHLSLIFTSQTVGRQRCAASTEERRVLPRSSPNIIPHGGGHKRKEKKYIEARLLSNYPKSLPHKYSIGDLSLFFCFVFKRPERGRTEGERDTEAAVKRSFCLFCAGLSNYATAWKSARLAGRGARSIHKINRTSRRSGYACGVMW